MRNYDIREGTIPGPQPYRAVLPSCRSVELRMAP